MLVADSQKHLQNCFNFIYAISIQNKINVQNKKMDYLLYRNGMKK